MRIVDVEAVVVEAPDQPRHHNNEVVLVTVSSDSGLTGMGEGHGHPAAIKALVDERRPGSWGFAANIREVLLGLADDDPRSAWAQLAERTFGWSRNGLGHVALAAVDMALWDLAGKVVGRPVWSLLGEARADPVRPYATIYRGAGPFDRVLHDSLVLVDRALELGLTAVKVEPLRESAPADEQVVSFVREVRQLVGRETTLLVDLGYRWERAVDAIDCLRRVEEYGPICFETPLRIGDLDEHLRLAEALDVPLAGAEVLVAHDEFVDFLDRGGAGIAQASPSSLGITELDRLARSCRERGKELQPHGWSPTVLGTAANLHVASVHGDITLVEYAPPALYPEYTLRAVLAGPEPALRDGVFDRPTEPGLGVSLDPDALARYRLA
jgi:L-rhamnonate dehydratase